MSGNGKPKHKMPVSKLPIYGNAIIQAPDGVQLCKIDDKRADWYINHPEDIAYEIANEDGPRIVRLRFEPSGREGTDDLFLQSDKRNECAVCGAKDCGLTKHHVVPWSYRKHLPPEVIKNCFHDIVPLCVDCHGAYEKTVHTYKLILCDKYGVSIQGVQPKADVPLGRAINSAFAILRHGDRIPSDRRGELEQRISDYLGHCTDEDLVALTDKHGEYRRMVGGLHAVKSHGRMVVEKLTLEDLQEFFEGWRNHFLINAEPQFMPDYWSLTRKVKGT